MSIPGLRCLDHIGFTAPDFEQASTFLVDMSAAEGNRWVYFMSRLASTEAGPS